MGRDGLVCLYFGARRPNTRIFGLMVVGVLSHTSALIGLLLLFLAKLDTQVVIEHLRESGRTSTIALWGRSMGAATALLHGERDPSIAGMVLDSSFADLTMLAEEMVEKGRKHGLFAPGK
jgi:predicted alpha/beta-fold hydrolase